MPNRCNAALMPRAADPREAEMSNSTPKEGHLDQRHVHRRGADRPQRLASQALVRDEVDAARGVRGGCDGALGATRRQGHGLPVPAVRGCGCARTFGMAAAVHAIPRPLNHRGPHRRPHRRAHLRPPGPRTATTRTTTRTSGWRDCRMNALLRWRLFVIRLAGSLREPRRSG